MLKTYRTYDSIVRFSKYESYNKLLDDVTLYIYIYIINFELKKKKCNCEGVFCYERKSLS